MASLFPAAGLPLSPYGAPTMVPLCMMAVLFSLELVGQAPQEAPKEPGEWVVIESKEGRFSFVMPVQPRELTNEQQTPAGKLKSTVYMCAKGDSALVFRYEVLPHEVGRVDTTSDAAFRTFMMAMEAGDEETLGEITLPNPDFDWLLRGEPPRGLGIADLKQRMLKARIQRLKVGDRVTMPDNSVHVIRPDEVGRDRAALRMEGTPAYAPLQRVKGHWRVDPAPFIAANKAPEAPKEAPRR
jgi:hypothetical protein